MISLLVSDFQRSVWSVQSISVACPWLRGQYSSHGNQQRCYVQICLTLRVLLFPSIPFPFHFSFSKIKNCYFLPFSLLFPSTFKSLKKWGVEGNSNFKIAISFHFFINFNNCYFLPFWLLFPSTFLKLLFPSTFLYEWRC